MKKVVVRLDLHDDKEKKKAMKAAATVKGIDSIAMDMKGKKLTVTGDVDPIKIASKLRKIWPAEIVSVGPAKEPEKKEEPKKEEGPKKEEEPTKKEEPGKEENKKEEEKKGEEKKEEEKKEDAKKEADEKKEEPKKEEEKKKDPNDHALELIKSYKAYYPHLTTHYHVQSVEDNPNACVIS